MKKAELMDLIHSTHREWEQVLAQIPSEKMDTPINVAGWSVTDVIAHITWSEREMVGLLKSRVLEGSPLWNLDTDTRNQIVYEENKDQSLEQILLDSQQVYADLLAELDKIEDQDLVDSSRIEKMPADWQLWQILAGSTFRHYQEHTADLRASSLFVEDEKKMDGSA